MTDLMIYGLLEFTKLLPEAGSRKRSPLHGRYAAAPVHRVGKRPPAGATRDNTQAEDGPLRKRCHRS